MKNFTFEELKTIVKTYVKSNMISNGTFTATFDNVAGLLDKIGKQITIDGLFPDKLPEFDGEPLPLGKTIEEYYQDLILAEDFDSTGAGALSPKDPTFRKPTYSYSLGRKKFKTTKRYDDIERACLNEETFNTIVNGITKRLYDSFSLYKYGVKKEMISVLSDKMTKAKTEAVPYTTSKEPFVYVKNSGSTLYGVTMRKTTESTYENAVKKGEVVTLDLIQQLAVPVDTQTGEAFIKQVKKDIETASFANEGHSLSGNTIGAENGLMLLVKKGVMPSLEVDTEAGAIHLDKLALNAKVKVLDDFGSADNGLYAILIDPRAMRLHPTYQVIREQINGDGDFINYFLHTNNTAFISMHCFVKGYKA